MNLTNGSTSRGTIGQERGRNVDVEAMNDIIEKFPARLTRSDVKAIAPEGKLLELAQERAPDPTVFDEYPPHFWSAEFSSSRWDSYDTRMGTSSLRNFVEAATAGVAFLRNHDTRTDALGHTLLGKFLPGSGGDQRVVTAESGDGGAPDRALAAFYAITDPTSVPYIAKMRAGVVRDVSVGFSGGQWLCSICQKDMRQWWAEDGCRHLLGMDYVPRDETGQKIKGAKPIRARATIENSILREISGVYEGATPEAMILKGRALAEAGELSVNDARLVEARYRIRLPEARHIHTVDGEPFRKSPEEPGQRLLEEKSPEPAPPGSPEKSANPDADAKGADGREDAGKPAEKEQDVERTISEETYALIRSLLPKDFDPNASATDVIVALVSRAKAGTEELETLRPLKAEVERMRPMADYGSLCRSNLIEDALTEGVRARGNDWPKEENRVKFERMSVEDVEFWRDEFRSSVKLTEGRKTTDDVETPPDDKRTEAPTAPAVPDSAYSTRGVR